MKWNKLNAARLCPLHYSTVPYVYVVSRVRMENWLVRQCIYAVTAFIESKSVEEVQQRFRHEFGVGRHGRIPSCSAILN
jgi:hypothetical protein